MDALVVEYDFRRSDGHIVRKRIEAVDGDEYKELIKIITSNPERYKLITVVHGRKK